MASLQEIITEASSYLPRLEPRHLEEAFHYAEKVHQKHYRRSGDPYVKHLLAICERLLPFKPDESTLIAALMHDISRGEAYDFEYIRKHFGSDVATMVEHLEKINTISLRTATTETESLQKVFLSMASDVRVVLIRMADRLHNMETLDFVAEEKRKPIAKETMDIYVPLAARLGIYKMKWRLEDLAFKYLQPNDYDYLKHQLDEYLKKQVSVIDYIQNELKTFLSSRKIKARVEGRLKNIYSIYNKLKSKNHTSLYEIFDIFAFRIILPARYNKKGEETTEHLYGLLGLLHHQWPPLSNRFKDYIALPKPNGYKSLHTTVLGLTPMPLEQPTEIQIRSERMDEESNFGIASHWLYKEDKSFLPSRDFLEQLQHDPQNFSQLKDATVETFMRIHRDLGKKQKVMQPVNVDVFKDRIFVLTPEGDIKDLPKGSTPLDFAYAIHTDIGHRYQGAKINNGIVPMDYELKNGEIVEILLKSKPEPKMHWLSFVKTAQAKAKIKNYFKNLDIDRYFRLGKEEFNKFLAQNSLSLLDENLSSLKEYDHKKLSFRERQSLIAEIGSGAVAASLVFKKVFGQQFDHPASKTHEVKEQTQKLVAVKGNFFDQDQQVVIGGEAGVPYKLSQCCKPKKGQDIVAYVGRGKAVRIHLQRCKLLKNVDQQRTMEAFWYRKNPKQPKKQVKVMLEARDRVGLIRDIADVIADFNVNIFHFSGEERVDNLIRREMILEITRDKQLTQVLQGLRQVRNVMKVKTF